MYICASWEAIFGHFLWQWTQQQHNATSFLFQIKYSLQSLCPQLAKAIRGILKQEKQ